MFALPFLDILIPGMWFFFFFKFNFPLTTFNFSRGKDAFSSISETIFLKTVGFTALCLSMIPSFFLPQVRQAKYYMMQGSISSDSHSSSSSSDSGGNYEKYRIIFQHCSECWIRNLLQHLMFKQNDCILLKLSGLFLSFIRAASKLLFGN